MKERKCISRILIVVMLLLIIPMAGIGKALADSWKITFSVDSLKSVTTKGISIEDKNIKYTITWTNVFTDVESGYYTKVTMQKKTGLVYLQAAQPLQFNDPVKGRSLVVDYKDKLGSGNYRYVIYSYGANIDGNIITTGY